MNKLVGAFICLAIGHAASAAKIDIGRVDAAPTHTCEIESLEVEARFDNQPSRLILKLKDARTASYLSCPKSVWIPAGGRAEVLRLYDIFGTAKEASCLISGAVSSARASVQCDAGFNVRAKVH